MVWYCCRDMDLLSRRGTRVQSLPSSFGAGVSLVASVLSAETVWLSVIELGNNTGLTVEVTVQEVKAGRWSSFI